MYFLTLHYFYVSDLPPGDEDLVDEARDKLPNIKNLQKQNKQVELKASRCFDYF